MDVDQSFLLLPSPVKAVTFESFARQNLSEFETDVTSGIKKYLLTKYGFPINNAAEFRSILLQIQLSVSLLGGLPLSMLTGGVNFAFLAVDQSLFAETTNGFAGLTKPHSTTRYAMKKLLAQAEHEGFEICGRT